MEKVSDKPDSTPAPVDTPTDEIEETLAPGTVLQPVLDAISELRTEILGRLDSPTAPPTGEDGEKDVSPIRKPWTHRKPWGDEE
jgi:hypothetical protein